MPKKTLIREKYYSRRPFDLGAEAALSFKYKSSLINLITYQQEANALYFSQTAEKFKLFLDKIKERGGEIKEEAMVYSNFASNPKSRSEFLKGFMTGIEYLKINYGNYII